MSIEDHALCPRYSALVFENVTVQPSPEWLQQRLESVGMNPINNIVDVTNYVLAEIAQPMHAFDAAKLQGDEIIVRSARAGENIKALNEESYTLDPSNLVIADPGGPVAIAGIIGGADSAISDSTTRIVLESANFNASSVRKTSAKLKLRTDASMRFEKAQDPVNTIRGLERAFTLLQEVSPGISRSVAWPITIDQCQCSRRSCSRSTGSIASSAGPSLKRKFAGFSNRSSFESKRSPRASSPCSCRAGAHERRGHQG